MAGEEDLFESDKGFASGNFLSSPVISRVFVDCSTTRGSPLGSPRERQWGDSDTSSLGLRRLPRPQGLFRLAEARTLTLASDGTGRLGGRVGTL